MSIQTSVLLIVHRDEDSIFVYTGATTSYKIFNTKPQQTPNVIADLRTLFPRLSPYHCWNDYGGWRVSTVLDDLESCAGTLRIMTRPLGTHLIMILHTYEAAMGHFEIEKQH